MSYISVTNNEKLNFFFKKEGLSIGGKNDANKKFLELTRNINPIKYTWDL